MPESASMSVPRTEILKSVHPMGADAEQAWWSQAAVCLGFLLFAVAIVVLRRPSSVMHPELWAEDGRVWFASAYNGGWWTTLWQPYSGYLQVFPRLVADAGLDLPLRDLPALFAWVAIVVQALPAVIVASKRFSHILPRTGTRVLFAVIYLLIPNSGEVSTNVTNAQWHLALLAVVCLLAAPGGLFWRAFDVVAIVLSGLTGPFVIVLALVGTWWTWRKAGRDHWTVVLWCLTIGLAAVQAAEVLGSHRASGLAGLGISIPRLLGIIGGQIGFGSVIGAHGVLALVGRPHAVALYALGTVAVLAVWSLAIFSGPPALRMFTLYAIGVLLSALASPVVSLTTPQWQVLVSDVGARYWMFPILAFLASCIWLAGRVVSPTAVWAGRYRPLSSREREPRVRSAAILGAGALAALLLVVSASWAIRTDFRQLPTVAVGYQNGVSRFLRAHPGQEVAIPTDPIGWYMPLWKH